MKYLENYWPKIILDSCEIVESSPCMDYDQTDLEYASKFWIKGAFVQSLSWFAVAVMSAGMLWLVSEIAAIVQ